MALKGLAAILFTVFFSRRFAALSQISSKISKKLLIIYGPGVLQAMQSQALVDDSLRGLWRGPGH